MRIPFMLSCDEFRLQTGGDPANMGWSQRLHQMMCGACRRFSKDVQRLDRRLKSAVRFDLDAESAAPKLPGEGRRGD